MLLRTILFNVMIKTMLPFQKYFHTSQHLQLHRFPPKKRFGRKRPFHSHEPLY